MSWQVAFKQSVALYRAAEYAEALVKLDETIAINPEQAVVWDTRSAVHEKLGNYKEALNDAKLVIKLTPDRWQGYYRAARLFAKIPKHQQAITMADYALQRLSDQPNEASKRTEMEEIKASMSAAAAARAKRKTYHFGMLPVEIIRDIFTLIVQTESYRAVFLSHVSKHWRQVALSSVDLWQTLVLRERRYNKQRAKISVWIQRSNGRIRKLRLFNPYHDITDSEDGNERSEAWLADPMWEGINWDILTSVEIMTPSGQLPKGLTEIARNISRVDLRQVPGGMSPGQVQTNINPRNLDRLSHVRIDHNDEMTDLSCLRGVTTLQCIELRNISLSRDMVDEMDNLLRTNSAISEFDVTIKPGWLRSSLTIDTQSTSKVLLPALEHLETDAFHGLLFDRFTFPNLQVLRILDDRRLESNWFDKFTENVPLHLTELSIQSSRTNAEGLVRVLQQSHHLRILGLPRSGSQSTIASTVIELLASHLSQPEKTPVCPMLDSIDLNSTNITSGPVVRLVKSRLPGISEENPKWSQIKSLNLDNCEGITAEVLPWLRQNVRQLSCVFMSKADAHKNRRHW